MYRLHGALQRPKSPTRYICEDFGAWRSSSFSTQSAKALNRCAIVRPLRRCGLPASMVAAGRNVERPRIPRPRCGRHHICIVKNLNDEHRAIGEAVIILTSRLKQFRLDKIEVWCSLQKLVRPMMLQGCRKADRAEVVERDLFTTPNSLKSHKRQKELSPLVQHSCHNAKVVHPF